jgi:hypothetical protein
MMGQGENRGDKTERRRKKQKKGKRRNRGRKNYVGPCWTASLARASTDYALSTLEQQLERPSCHKQYTSMSIIRASV